MLWMVSGKPAGASNSDIWKKGSVKVLRSLVVTWAWVLQTSIVVMVSPVQEWIRAIWKKGRATTKARSIKPPTVLVTMIKVKSTG